MASSFVYNNALSTLDLGLIITMYFNFDKRLKKLEKSQGIKGGKDNFILSGLNEPTSEEKIEGLDAELRDIISRISQHESLFQKILANMNKTKVKEIQDSPKKENTILSRTTPIRISRDSPIKEYQEQFDKLILESDTESDN